MDQYTNIQGPKALPVSYTVGAFSFYQASALVVILQLNASQIARLKIISVQISEIFSENTEFFN
jgi:hypothetical protein